MVEYDRTPSSRSAHPQQPQSQQQQQQQQPQPQPHPQQQFQQQQMQHQHQQLHGRESAQYQNVEHQSAPTTPSPPYQYAPMQQFAHQHQQHSVRSTPTSYPSPASFPSPSMTAYAAYPAQALPSQSHNSPSVQAMSASSAYSLPPIRMTPPNSSLPPAGMPMATTASLPQPPTSAGMYYQQQPGYPMPLQSSLPAAQLSQPGRFSQPSGAPERIMSGGRHKKEIKRRTKTGCLTCRKRRIKCDEAHPSCKNCAKSKRECLGYDPIFKSQTGPSPILPPGPSGSVPASSMPMQHNGMMYGHPNPPPPPIIHAQPTYAYGPSMSTAENSPASSCEPYEFNVIDPALESTPIPMPQLTQSVMTGLPHDMVVGQRMELKRGYDRTSPFPSSISDSARMSATPVGGSGSPSSSNMKDAIMSNSAKRIKIDDLLGKPEERAGSPLTPTSADLAGQPLTFESVQFMYRTHYGPVLDALVETGWFQTKGLERIMRNDQFADSFVAVLTRINCRNGNYIQEDVSVPKFSGDAGLLMESIKVLWGTRASGTIAPAYSPENENDYVDNSDLLNRDLTVQRLSIIEALLSPPTTTSEFIKVDMNNDKTSNGKQEPDENQLKFWDALGRFVSLSFCAENIMQAQKCLEEISHTTMDIRFRELLFRIAEAKFFKYRLREISDRYEDEENLGSYESIFRRASEFVNDSLRPPTETNFPDIDAVAQRIAGRALSLWGQPLANSSLMLF